MGYLSLDFEPDLVSYVVLEGNSVVANFSFNSAGDFADLVANNLSLGNISWQGEGDFVDS